MFPIPRITESFIDGVIENLGWRRYVDIREPLDGEMNVDYVSPHELMELKIFEEEGLQKSERQTKIAALYREVASAGAIVDIELDHVPDDIRREFETLVSRPLQSAVKKAAKQIRSSSATLGMEGGGILIGVNNGYSYLNADNFEKLLVRRCRNDSTHIDHAVCISVDYHQGDFHAFVFCTVRCHAVRGGPEWGESKRFQTTVLDAFDDAMTQMMRDQMNPILWDQGLSPIADIRFERGGVVYVREAPYIPDSRF
ncbi:MAG: hypothetical protein FD165_2663 [Gammaproteobacteria bacterium]|nr:MAG: hypothetical protein FD165_2663 [Gammaproteobacteria bacterium]TND01136.1 MAG: hypothetical protein FD120_2672 [Gammaproteobacteria bacterium]